MSVKKFNKQLTEYRRLQRNKNRYNKSDKLNKGTQKTMFDYLMKSSLFKPSKSFMKRIRNDKAVKRFAERSFYENYKNRMMEQPGTYQNLLNMGYKSDIMGNIKISGRELFKIFHGGKYEVTYKDLESARVSMFYQTRQGQDAKLILNYINFENELIKNFGEQGLEYAKHLQQKISNLKVDQRRAFMESLSSGRFGVSITGLYQVASDVMLEEEQKIEKVSTQVEDTIDRILKAKLK